MTVRNVRILIVFCWTLNNRLISGNSTRPATKFSRLCFLDFVLCCRQINFSRLLVYSFRLTLRAEYFTELPFSLPGTEYGVQHAGWQKCGQTENVLQLLVLCSAFVPADEILSAKNYILNCKQKSTSVCPAGRNAISRTSPTCVRCTPFSGQPFAAGHRTHCPIKCLLFTIDTGQ